MSTERPQIEHPEVTIGVANAHILDTLTVAYRASLKLAEEGFTVLSVEVADRNPRVNIQPCGRCARLKGVAMVTRNRERGREQVMVANVYGAQVQWTERQH